MRLPHEIEVGEIVGLRHWKLITQEGIIPPLHACVPHAINPGELTKITGCDFKIVRETKLSSGLIGEGIIWPTNERVEAKCISDMPRISRSLTARFSQFEDTWCPRRGDGPAPCTMDRPFVCNDGYNSSQCGVYAWNTQGIKTRDIEAQIYETVCAPTNYIVWGLVALSGRVVEHEEGYRAEFARPIALLDSATSLLDLYKVESYSNMEALLLGLYLYEKERKKKGRK